MGLVRILNKKLFSKFGFNVIRSRQRALLDNQYAMRFLYFIERCREISDLSGCIVECGVGWGGGLLNFAYAEKSRGTKRTIWGFDTFEGFPSIHEEDQWASRPGQLARSQEQVLEYLKSGGIGDDFITSYIRLVKGDVKETTKDCKIDRIALLHLDLDLYEGYKYALENLYDRVVRGGIVMFDEYREEKWPGATKAIDEFFGEKTQFFCHDANVNRYFLRKERFSPSKK